jgi:hypothetical protein
METLKALNKSSLYKFILVETLPRHQIPEFLKKVPTLYNPESKEVIVGKDIFGYIGKPTNSRAELPTKGQQQVTGDISAWGFEGRGSLTEAFSDWNSPTSHGSDGNSMYTFLGGSQVSGPQESKPENTLNKGVSDVTQRMQAMEEQRKKEFGGVQRT